MYPLNRYLDVLDTQVSYLSKSRANKSGFCIFNISKQNCSDFLVNNVGSYMENKKDMYLYIHFSEMLEAPYLLSHFSLYHFINY